MASRETRSLRLKKSGVFGLWHRFDAYLAICVRIPVLSLACIVDAGFLRLQRQSRVCQTARCEQTI